MKQRIAKFLDGLKGGRDVLLAMVAILLIGAAVERWTANASATPAIARKAAADNLRQDSLLALLIADRAATKTHDSIQDRRLQVLETNGSAVAVATWKMVLCHLQGLDLDQCNRLQAQPPGMRRVEREEQP